MSSDQWLLNGDCTYCRKAKYCKKDCSARKQATAKILKNAFYDVLEEKYPEMAEFMSNTLGMDRYDERF